jgi:hypothetical protein
MLAIAGNMLRRRYILFLATSLAIYFLASTLPSALAHEINTMDNDTTKTGFDPALLGASPSSSPNPWMLSSALLVLVIAGSTWRRRYILFPLTIYFLITTLPSDFAHEINNAGRNTSDHIDLIVWFNGRASLSSPSIWMLVYSLLTLAIASSMWQRRCVVFLASLSNLPTTFAQPTNTFTVTPWIISQKEVYPTLITHATSTDGLSKWLFGLLVLFLALTDISSRQNPWLYRLALLIELPVALAQELNATKLTEHKGVDSNVFKGGSVSRSIGTWVLLASIPAFAIAGNIRIRQHLVVLLAGLGIMLPVAFAQEMNHTGVTEHKGVDPNAFHGGSISHGFDKWMLLIPLLGFVVVGNANIRHLIGAYSACLGSLLPIALAQETNTSEITEHKGAGPIISGAAIVANLAPWAFVAFLLSLFLLGHIKPGLFLTRRYMSHGVAAQTHEKKPNSADASATSTSTRALIAVGLFVTWGAIWGLLFM